jgi:hypothetical protein
MISFKDFLELNEDILDEELHRIDSKLIRNPVTDFSAKQHTYINNPDHSHSGQYAPSGRRKPRVKNTVTKATYAGRPEFTARYAAPRDVRQIVHDDSDSGKKVIVFQKSDEEKIRKNRPVLSVWKLRDANKAKFQNTRDDEFRSSTPGRPTSQRVIRDPIKHMEKHGYKVKFVKDIETHRKKIDKSGRDYDTDGFLD